MSISAITDVISTFFKSKTAPILLLLVLTGITYSEVLNHTFLINWDDQAYITKNHAIRGFTLDHIKTAFTSYYVGNYAPIQILSYMLDFALWGGNPFGYLLANILYHFLSGVLLYLLLLRQGCRTWAAVLGTAVFLVHPVQVESVAWLSQRKNLLAMLMYLAAFHSYLTYRDSRNGYLRWYVASVIFFFLSLLAKSVAVVFPLMLVVYDLLMPPFRRRFREHLNKLPYFAAAAAFGLLAMITQSDNHGGGRVAYPENALVVVPFSMLPVLVNYLRLAIWPDPSRLCVLYFPPLKTYLDGTVFLAICISILLVMVGWYCYRKDRTVLFWYTLFFIGLLPVSQIVPLITMMNDRYLYFPMLGVAGLVAHGSGRLWERVRTIPWRGYAMLAICAGLVNALSVASSIRGRVWMDSITLFGDAVAKYPNEASALSRLAEGYVAAGDLNKARGLYESARLKGTLDDLAVYNLVQIYFEQKEFDAAYKLISEIQPGNEKIMRKSLLLGEYLYRIGNYPDAEENLLAHLAQEPDSAHGLYLLGQTYLMTGYTERAGELYYKAVAAGGDNAGLFFALACAESMQGHVGKSLAALESALRNGLSSKDLQEGEGCLKNIRNGPRYRQLFQQYLGANRP